MLALCFVLFAYSTLITWYYYGEKGLTFLFGEKEWLMLVFKLVFCAFVIVAGDHLFQEFALVGASLNL